MALSPLYSPPPGLRSQLNDFREYIGRKHEVELKTYDDLHRFSTTRLNDFWLSLWSFAGFKASRQPYQAINDQAKIDAVPTFFEGIELNFAENIFETCCEDAIAVIDVDETTLSSGGRRVTWKELRRRVSRASQALRRLNVERGDVVALVGPNSSESLVLLLASASIGAVFSSFATDVGQNALLDRLCQLRPKLLVAQHRYRYNGKQIDITDTIITCHNALERSGSVILATFGASASPLLEHSLSFDDLVGAESATEICFERVAFNSPLVVMFSSGTTGAPKGIVHGHGGLMLNGWKENFLHNDFGEADLYFHYSGIGWTLWNISLGALFCNTSLVMYDGSPMYPSCAAFLEALFALGVTAFGSSPRYFHELQVRNVRAQDLFPRGQLRMLLSTGALLTPGLAMWLAQSFGPLCQIGFSGGTELCGSFVTGTTSLPSYPGEITVKALGMAVDCYDANGRPCPAGATGELVCIKPFPNMPVRFWNDPSSQKYHDAYFATFEGVWTHGDLIRIDPNTKGIYVLGRSDGVLNPSGVRFGTGELYNVIASLGAKFGILDSLAVGQQRATTAYVDPAERVVLFLVLSPRKAHTRAASIIPAVRNAVAQSLSKRHVPHYIFAVDEIPYNANGKKMEVQVKQICNLGRSALDHMKVTDAEHRILQNYVQFHEIEQVSKIRQRDARL